MNGLRLIRRHAAAFGRFAGLGSGVTLAASAALVLLSQWIPWMAANALTTVASTVVATELHARVSFGHGRPGLVGHLKSAAAMALGWMVTSAAVGSLAVLRPAPDSSCSRRCTCRPPRSSGSVAISCCVWLCSRSAPRGPGPVAASGCGPRTTRRREGRRGKYGRPVPQGGRCRGDQVAGVGEDRERGGAASPAGLCRSGWQAMMLRDVFRPLDAGPMAAGMSSWRWCCPGAHRLITSRGDCLAWLDRRSPGRDGPPTGGGNAVLPGRESRVGRCTRPVAGQVACRRRTAERPG